MDELLDKFLRSVLHLSNVEDITMQFEALVKYLGFEQWAYHLKSQDVSDPPQIISNYSTDWEQHYVKENYTSIDPVVLAVEKSQHIYQWSDILASMELSPRQQQLFDESASYGLIDGIGIPFNLEDGKRLVVTLVNPDLSHNELKNLFIDKQHSLSVLAYLLHQQIQRSCPIPSVKLSPRELDCLVWLSNGKTYWEIGTIMNISERTVRFHINNIKKKLGANSQAEIIAKALRYGLAPL